MSAAETWGGVAPTRPTIARVHNDLLGGKDNYEVDRDLVDELLRFLPSARQLARYSRAFLGDSVHDLARAGTGTFIDLGCGMPTRVNTHQLAREWGARTVYVDNDRLVLAHAHALLDDGPDVLVSEADLREASPLDDPAVRQFIDWTRPVGIIAVAILEYLPAAAAHRLLQQARRLPAGSTLVLSTLVIPDRDQRQTVSRLLSDATGVQTLMHIPRCQGVAVPEATTSEQPYMASAVIPLRPCQPGPIQTKQVSPHATGTPARLRPRQGRAG